MTFSDHTVTKNQPTISTDLSYISSVGNMCKFKTKGGVTITIPRSAVNWKHLTQKKSKKESKKEFYIKSGPYSGHKLKYISSVGNVCSFMTGNGDEVNIQKSSVDWAKNYLEIKTPKKSCNKNTFQVKFGKYSGQKMLYVSSNGNKCIFKTADGEEVLINRSDVNWTGVKSNLPKKVFLVGTTLTSFLIQLFSN